MTREQQDPEVLRQPARGELIKLPPPPRLPLDWGDEEPDPVWEDLYYKGVVDPPYRSGKDRAELMELLRANYKPVGKPMTDEELMCALGRCRCSRCE